MELELGREYYFHSIFACPVSKDQSTKDNPPMALPCGHVLSKESIQSIAKKERIRPFKCPYCPHECKFTGERARRRVVNSRGVAGARDGQENSSFNFALQTVGRLSFRKWRPSSCCR